jgi:hypothetical protein
MLDSVLGPVPGLEMLRKAFHSRARWMYLMRERNYFH